MRPINPFRVWSYGRLIAASACSLPLIALCLLGGVSQAYPAPDVSATQRAAIYARGTNEFATGFYYKPAGEENSGPNFELAPLLMQRVTGDALKAMQGIEANGFGTLTFSNSVLTVNARRQTIYWSADTLQLNDHSHMRFAYVWCYSVKGGVTADSGLDGFVQGVRITLDLKGEPCVWEILCDQSGADLIFVSSALESMAAAESGKALPGRHFAIERSVAEAPDVVVPRIIQHNPTAMGPWVYLAAGTHDVSTLICRCMPAQVKNVAGTRAYTLLQAVNSPEFTSLGELILRAKIRTSFWPGQSREAGRLEKRLRLPKDF